LILGIMLNMHRNYIRITVLNYIENI